MKMKSKKESLPDLQKPEILEELLTVRKVSMMEHELVKIQLKSDGSMDQTVLKKDIPGVVFGYFRLMLQSMPTGRSK